MLTQFGFTDSTVLIAAVFILTQRLIVMCEEIEEATIILQLGAEERSQVKAGADRLRALFLLLLIAGPQLTFQVIELFLQCGIIYP
ncbi:hypothetical protein [Erwinia rhapontici]|uniref:hypothetical protein n=1 Tax=Erwinia rhapontici TaxID=55212 RepID=UPI003D35C472